MTGEKIWAGDVNCRNVTWQQCELRRMEVVEEVELFDCLEAPEQTITYDVLEEAVEAVASYRTECRAAAVPECRTRHETRCLAVEWEECEDRLQQDCSKFSWRLPSQEEEHTVRCPLRH